MSIKLKGFEGELNLLESEIVCVSKQKYADVYLCFKIEGGYLVEFASIELHDGTYKDKESKFSELKKFGEKLSEVWNLYIKNNQERK